MRASWQAGAFDRATTQALEGYGAEVFGYLVAVAGDHGLAGDAFSLLSERLWKTLPGFEWRCTLRGWIYLLARNALTDLRRGPAGKPHVPLSQASAVGRLAVAIRSRTETHLRSEVKSALQLLRESLPKDDQTLLILRLDRDMAWEEIAHVFAGEDGLAEADVARESARLRKRYQLVKQRFAALARERGLVGTGQ